MVPVYVSAVSLLIFLVNVIVAKRQAKNPVPAAAGSSPNGHEVPATPHSLVPDSASECIIIATNVVRLIACAGLTVLAVFTVLSAARSGSFDPGVGFEWDLSEVDVPLLAISQAAVFVRATFLRQSHES
jgi:hypothetical protein